MKKIVFVFLTLLLSFSVSALSAQGFNPPAEGKSVVYFVRVTELGFAIPFQFFDNDKFIGEFAGKKYMRYECEPGEHLFWASSENKEFLTAELKPDECYLVIVDVKMGIGIARVGLTPITQNHEVFERAKKLVDKKAPAITPQETIDRKGINLASFISEKLQAYHDHWKQEKNFNHLAADMAIPLKSGDGVEIIPTGQ
jgi:hypothetical protein